LRTVIAPKRKKEDDLHEPFHRIQKKRRTRVNETIKTAWGGRDWTTGESNYNFWHKMVKAHLRGIGGPRHLQIKLWKKGWIKLGGEKLRSGEEKSLLISGNSWVKRRDNGS